MGANKYDKILGEYRENDAVGSGSPGGFDTNVQFNDGGVFGGNSSFNFDKTAKLLRLYSETKMEIGGTSMTQPQLGVGYQSAAPAHAYLRNSHDLRIGIDSENNFTGFDENGFQRMQGDASPWKRSSVTAIMNNNGNNAQLIQFIAAPLECLSLGQERGAVNCTLPIPEDFREGQGIYFFINWAATSDLGASNYTVSFNLTYAYAAPGGNFVSSVDTVGLDTVIGEADSWEDFIAVSDGVGVAPVVGGKFVVGVQRNPRKDTALSLDTAILEIGFYYQADTIGGHSMGAK